MATNYRDEARQDAAAAAEQKRLDQAAADERKATRQREADERTARLRAQARTEKGQDRAERKARRAERREARAASLTPQNVYSRGTLALVIASGLASLPAQIAHFAAISMMLLPVPLGIEGAAWVMAAGVAYADSRELPPWVRWLLRVLVVSAAGFAASINYSYGLSLAPGSSGHTAGLGLAAVSLLGPLLFEIRQWVLTLGAGDEEERKRRKHARKRRRHHRPVARLAARLESAAPYGTLAAEEAWRQAWEIQTGADMPGMTPALYRRSVRSAAKLTAAQQPQRGRWSRRTAPALPVAVSTPAVSAPVVICDQGSVLPVPALPPVLVQAPDTVYDHAADPAVSTMTPQVATVAAPAPVEADSSGDRLDAAAAKAAIEAAWEAGLTVREAAVRATRATSYVGTVYARLTKARGPQPSKGQTRIDDAA
jgi:hypothetical protein